MDLFGPMSLRRDGEWEGWVTDFLSSFRMTISGGTAEIRRNIIAERVLGLPRDLDNRAKAKQS